MALQKTYKAALKRWSQQKNRKRTTLRSFLTRELVDWVLICDCPDLKSKLNCAERLAGQLARRIPKQTKPVRRKQKNA